MSRQSEEFIKHLQEIFKGVVHKKNRQSDYNGSYGYNYNTTLQFFPSWPRNFLFQLDITFFKVINQFHLY